MEFSAEGQRVFILTSLIALENELIGEEEFITRMYVLSGQIERIEQGEPHDFDDPDGEEAPCGGSRAGDDLLQFTLNSGPMAKWFFRPGDADPLPSAPHGHLNNKSLPKLDPYTGGVWAKKKLVGQESRQNIAALWNDNGFRLMALKTIGHALQNSPLARGLIAKRTSNPYKLPRKRKP